MKLRGAKLRPEWWLAGLLVAAALFVHFVVRPPRVALSFEIYFQLASAFFTGTVGALLFVLGERVLALLPPAGRRRGQLVWRLAAATLALAIFLAVRPPRATAISRLLESAALGLFGSVALLAFFLPAAGLIRGRDVASVFGEALGRWLPWLTYLGCAGTLMAATLVSTPLVIDPVLLRMDLSLGFSPSEIIFAWEFDKTWVRFTSEWGYPLLGLFISGIAARLHLAGAAAQCRRCLLALTLVATFGLACYQLAPAIGPLHAFPGLFDRPANTPEAAAHAHALRDAIVAGPDRIAGSVRHPRNVMPSLHTAFTLVALAAAWNWRRNFFWLCLPIGVVQIFTALTLCVHYVVDLVAAVPFAALCWALADWLVRRAPGEREEPLAALASGRKHAQTFAASLALACVALLAWGWCAPFSPWLAWPLVGLIAGGPAWLGWRLHRRAEIPAETPATAPGQPRDWRVRLLTVAVFCSGGAALVLEQICEKYLSTLLGASRPASTIVLAVYFAGLALGAWLCPKGSAGAPRRLAVLELFIAGWAALVAVAFFACDRALGAWLARAGGGAFSLAAVRAAIAALWILPPTLAMGAQLPTLAAVLRGHELWRGQSLPRFYAVNLAGACGFTLATPPLLFDWAGADGALWAIAGLGAAVGIALWFGLPRVGTGGAPLGSRGAHGIAVAARPAWPWLAAAFAAGFVLFALEVVWFHLISAVCGASAHSFSILLAVVLLGLALGGRFAARGNTSTAALLGWLVVALALGNALWPWAGPLLARVQSVQRFESFWAGELLKLCVVALVALPTAALAGQIFPRLLRAGDAAAEPDRVVGAVCAANVLGCTVGALATGFALIPWLGAERTLLALAGLIAVGAALASLRRPRAAPLLLLAAGLALLCALPRWDRLRLTGGHGVYLEPQLARGAQLAFFREDFSTGFVTVVATPLRDRAAPLKTLLQNGKFDSDDGGEVPAQIGFGLVAALHAPARERALVIGCGSGQTASVIARLGFAHVDLAELSPADLQAAREHFGHINAGVLDRPNVVVHLEDGRNLLLRTAGRYDAIQIELSSVWFAGATNLYSREFYALARERLSAGGVVVQWVQLHHLTPRELAVIFATAQAEFRSVSLWRAGGQACLLMAQQAPEFRPATWERWRTASELFDERVVTGLLTPEAFAATQMLDAGQLRSLVARTPPAALNTDRNRWLEFQAPKYYLSRRDHRAENLRWIESARTTGPARSTGVTPRAARPGHALLLTESDPAGRWTAPLPRS